MTAGSCDVGSRLSALSLWCFSRAAHRARTAMPISRPTCPTRWRAATACASSSSARTRSRNTYAVNGSGNISMPLIGAVRGAGPDHGGARAQPSRPSCAPASSATRRSRSRSRPSGPSSCSARSRRPGQYPYINGMTAREGDRGRGRLHAARQQIRGRPHPRHRRPPGDRERAGRPAGQARRYDHREGTLLLDCTRHSVAAR